MDVKPLKRPVIKSEPDDEKELGPPRKKIKTTAAPKEKKVGIKTGIASTNKRKVTVKTEDEPDACQNANKSKRELSTNSRNKTHLSGMSWEAHNVVGFTICVEDRFARNVVKLLDEGCTIPFIARYRKEQTGGMEVHKIRDACTLLQELRAVETKVASIKTTLAEQSKMTPALNAAFSNAQTMAEVECLFAPFKPGHKGSLAERARALGLEALAMKFMAGYGCLMELNSFINKDEDGLSSVSKIKDGLKHIIADVVHKNTKVMEKIRVLSRVDWIVLHTSKSKAKAPTPKPGEKPVPEHKYQLYFDFKTGIGRIQSHQVLAINRGEHQKVLVVKVEIPDGLHRQMISCCQQQIMHGRMTQQCRQLVEESIEDAYTRLIHPQISRLVRSNLTKDAEKESILVFTSNLKNLLLTAPLKGQSILAIDPGYLNGCKTAVISKTGQVCDTAIIYMVAQNMNKKHARNQLQDLIIKHRIQIIAIGNGSACRETEAFVSDLIQASFPKLKYCIVSENGASIYSVSDIAQKELPDLDPSLRGAVSIGRRLLDPLAEFVKLDPENLGVGQYQHDMPRSQLKTSLDSTVEECVSFVGVDINTCSACLLSRVSGLSAAKAKKILEFRDTKGPFICREQLMLIKGLGEKTYEQAAGFIRIHQLDGKHSPNEHSNLPSDETGTVNQKGKKVVAKKKVTKKKKPTDLTANPLDMTWIHPESYDVTHKLLNDIPVDIYDIGQPLFVEKVKEYSNRHSIKIISEVLDCGEPTVKLIIEALVRPLTYDFRDEFEKPLFRNAIKSISDMKSGELVTGKVMNVTSFGAFVDIGLNTQGLIHKSKMWLKQTRERVTLKLGDKVEAKVEQVDVSRKRIGLILEKVL